MGLEPVAFRSEGLLVIRLDSMEYATNKIKERVKVNCGSLSRLWYSTRYNTVQYRAKLHAGGHG